MKKSRQARHFLFELQKTPVVSAVCAKLNLSRQSIYRWINEDPEFKKEYDLCLSHGVDNINDLAESKLIKKINDEDIRAITYWLESNKKKYYRPRKPADSPSPKRTISTVNIRVLNDPPDKKVIIEPEPKKEPQKVYILKTSSPPTDPNKT